MRHRSRFTVPLAAVCAGLGLVLLWNGGPRSEPAASASLAAHCDRPYAAWSPWNTPIVAPVVAPGSSAFVARLRSPLTSDPTQYTYPVYEAAEARVTVKLTGTFSDVTKGGGTLIRSKNISVDVPVPPGVRPADGTDAQLIVVDSATGDEWGFWEARPPAAGGVWTATNGYHYNTRWSAVPPVGFASRGAGVPYLAGLVRACEVTQRHIDHALAFAYAYPSPEIAFPATKSDGAGTVGVDLPEGSRLQLDPRVGPAQLRAWGCSAACAVIARALQRYGMYVIDNSGRSKVMLEGVDSAHWPQAVTAATISPIPASSLQVVSRPPVDLAVTGAAGKVHNVMHLRYSVFAHGDATRETLWVASGGGRIATFRRAFHVSISRAASNTISWVPPRSGRYRFCGQAAEFAGGLSTIDCAPLVVR